MDLNSYDNKSLGFETNNVQIYLTYFLIVLLIVPEPNA